MNENEKLKELSDNLKSFVENFYSSFYEESDNTYNLSAEIAKNIKERDIISAKYGSNFVKYDDSINKLEAEIKEAQANNDDAMALLRGSELASIQNKKKIEEEARKEAIDNFNKKIKEAETAIAAKKELIKDKLKENFKAMNEYIAVQIDVGNDKTSIANRIDSLIEKYTGALKDLCIDCSILNQKFEEAKKSGDLKRSQEACGKRNRAYKELERVQNLLNNLKEFKTRYNELEDALLHGDIFANTDVVTNCFNCFANVNDSLCQDVEKDLLTVNVTPNNDDTFTVDITCGYRSRQPRLVLSRSELTSDRIKQELEAFAGAVAQNSNLRKEDLLNSDVVLKHNYEFLKKDSLNKTCDAVDKIRTGQIDKIKEENTVKPEPTKEGGEPNPTKEGGESGPTKEGGESGPAKEGGESGPTKEGGESGPTKEGGESGPTKEGDGSTSTKGDGESEPTMGNGEPNPSMGNGQTLQGPDVDDHLLKVTNIRNAKANRYDSIKTVSLIAAAGLAAAGVTLGFGTGFAAIPLVVGAGTTALQLAGKAKDRLQYWAMRQKFKSVARKVRKATDTDFRYIEDPKTRRCGFVLQKGDTKILSSQELDAAFPGSGLGEGDDTIIRKIFDEEFEKVNKYRGKGSSARTTKEYDYRNFPKITLDNCEDAFRDWGGLKTKKELKDSKFNIAKIFHSIKKRQEEKEEENKINQQDNITSSDPSELEENTKAEAMSNAMGDGQGPTQGGQPEPQPTQGGKPTPQQPTQGEGPAPQPTQGGEPTGGQGQGGSDGQGDNQGGTAEPEDPTVEPLAPAKEDPEVMQIMFPKDQQDALKADLVLALRDKIQDSTDKSVVADALEEIILSRKAELSEQSKVDLVNMFHDEVEFTQEQMEKFDFICRNDRTLTNLEVQDTIKEFQRISQTQGEDALGSALSEFISKHKNTITKDDIEALKKVDENGDFITERLTEDLFNGRTLK